MMASVLLLVAIDHFLKVQAITNLPYGERLSALPVLDFFLVYNKGGAFSIFANAGGWQRYFFITSAGLVIMISLRVLLLSRTEGSLKKVALILMAAGVAGNLVDRILFGYVVDYFLLHWDDLSFAVFNFADVVIILAVMLSMIYMLRSNKNYF